MRVLFTANPDPSLFRQMVPLAWALRTAGHEVHVAVQPRFVDTVTHAGLTAVPVGRDSGHLRLSTMNVAISELQRKGMPSPYNSVESGDNTVDLETMRSGYRDMIQRWHKVDNFPLMSDLVDYALHWKPDLVIWEPLTYAGSIAATACGAAHARFLWSIDIFGSTRGKFLHLLNASRSVEQDDPLATWLGQYARKYGFEYSESLATGHASIDQFPASVRLSGDLNYLPMRYTPYCGTDVVPDWLWNPPMRRRIALTLGIAATDRFGGYVADVREILGSIADLDVEVVATIAESAQVHLGNLPDNVRLVTFAPLHVLASMCTAVINHAGPGTFLTTASYGVPQLHVPWDFDEPELARRSSRQGGSLTIRADQATGYAVREGVSRLLNETEFACNAMRLRDEILDMPSPGEVVGDLVQLASTVRDRQQTRRK